jgi:hypothetical protein
MPLNKDVTLTHFFKLMRSLSKHSLLSNVGDTSLDAKLANSVDTPEFDLL